MEDFQYDIQRFVENMDHSETASGSVNRELYLNRVLADITRKVLSEEYNIQRVAERTLFYALKLTGSRHGFVSAIDISTRENVIDVFTDKAGNVCLMEKNFYWSFAPDEDGRYPGLHGEALNTRISFFTNEPQEHDAFRGELPAEHVQIYNFLSVPVMFGNRLAGQIALANTPSGFDDADIRIVERLGDIYALALRRHISEIEKNRLEHELLQIQKLQAIGSLAGGIAHDFNNILSPVLGFAEMLQEDISLLKLSGEEHVQDYIQEIISGVRRAADLAQQMLVFSRQSYEEIKPVYLNGIIKETVRLSRAILPPTIEIRQHIDAASGQVVADPVQIQQALMNLITNAYHAMEDTSGTLTVELGNADIKVGDIAEPGRIGMKNSAVLLPDGRYVCLRVRDTGIGMDQATIENVFKPYFTTKEKHKGTGLGMSVTQGIVQSYQGDILIKSFPGKGTAVEVYLPRYQQAVSNPEKPTDPKSLQTGNERILWVDDEEVVLKLARRMLGRFGYEVETRSRPADALEVFRQNPLAFDLVISDLMMPQIKGDILVEKIKALRSDIPVILCTGFSDHVSPETLENVGIRGVIMKPIIKSELVKKVRDVLDYQ